MSPRAGLDTSVVVQAAADLVNAEGLEALSISRLAEKLGVQAPSLYNHVRGLPGLRRELALMGHRILAERLAEAAVGRSGEDALLAVAVEGTLHRPGSAQASAADVARRLRNARSRKRRCGIRNLRINRV